MDDTHYPGRRLKRIYVDTSVIGGCCDLEFAEWSHVFMNEVKMKKVKMVVSDLTIKELEKAPKNVQNVLRQFENNMIEYIYSAISVLTSLRKNILRIKS